MQTLIMQVRGLGFRAHGFPVGGRDPAGLLTPFPRVTGVRATLLCSEVQPPSAHSPHFSPPPFCPMAPHSLTSGTLHPPTSTCCKATPGRMGLAKDPRPPGLSHDAGMTSEGRTCPKPLRDGAAVPAQPASSIPSARQIVSSKFSVKWVRAARRALD